MPYVAGDLSTPPSKAAITAQAAFKLKGKAWRVIPDNAAMLQAVLSQGYPIMLAITVWESFDKGGINGLLTIPDTTKEAYLGNHGVLLCGFDLNKQVWIIRNEWDITWGDQGYCYMPFGYEKLWLAAWSADLG